MIWVSLILQFCDRTPQWSAIPRWSCIQHSGVSLRSPGQLSESAAVSCSSSTKPSRRWGRKRKYRKWSPTIRARCSTSRWKRRRRSRLKLKKDKRVFFFISVPYELRELGEQAQSRAIDTRDKFVIILIPTFMSFAANWSHQTVMHWPMNEKGL